MKDFINKYHLIRRTLVFAILYCFLKITVNIFSGGVVLDEHLTTVYKVFGGMITLILIFYLRSGKNDAEGD
ncbi:MAG: hypothetical protein KAW56_16835 [Candidatus Marinimicrobia bacterium]|nr:hypothetical protein [Candidatus Neomarinimicrobiota bacterium]